MSGSLDEAITLIRQLSDPDPASTPWPAGVRLGPFGAGNGRRARALLNAAYARGGGAVEPFETWWPPLRADSEFDPRLCFVFEDAGSGALVGFAHGWTSAFVKDIAVDPDWRRRGLGRALMEMMFAAYRARGFAAVRLKVRRDNRSGALDFYRSLGMTPEPVRGGEGARD